MAVIYPKIGAHISAAGNMAEAPLRAHAAGCECFQFFSRPPQGGPAKPITDKLAQEFKDNCSKHKLNSYIHAPYYINLASAKNNIYYGSISVIRDELERGSLLGVKYVVIHVGSAKELGKKEGIKKSIEGLVKILDGYSGRTELLLEISAGAGEIIGGTFDELAEIVKHKSLAKYDLGICYDTCHGFASGYDIRTTKVCAATFKQFDKILGLKKLKLIHVNDSIFGLNSHKDRHVALGQGEIGLEGFKAIVALAKKLKIDLITEIPHEGDELKDVKILQNFRDKK